MFHVLSRVCLYFSCSLKQHIWMEISSPRFCLVCLLLEHLRGVCVWFLCGPNTRSIWQECVFRFPCALACNGCRLRTCVPGHLSRDSCTTQVLARPGFRFAHVVPSCHEVLPKLLRRQAGSSTSLPLVCLGHVCSACWVTFDGAGVALR